jgi:hypothetical protein
MTYDALVQRVYRELWYRIDEIGGLEVSALGLVECSEALVQEQDLLLCETAFGNVDEVLHLCRCEVGLARPRHF